MKINIDFTIEITEEALDLLIKIGEEGYAEYRDNEYPTLEDFKKSNIFLEGRKDENWFLQRNFGGTYHLIEQLEKNHLVDFDLDCWNTTYCLSKFGKTIYERNKDKAK